MRKRLLILLCMLTALAGQAQDSISSPPIRRAITVYACWM